MNKAGFGYAIEGDKQAMILKHHKINEKSQWLREFFVLLNVYPLLNLNIL